MGVGLEQRKCESFSGIAPCFLQVAAFVMMVFRWISRSGGKIMSKTGLNLGVEFSHVRRVTELIDPV